MLRRPRPSRTIAVAVVCVVAVVAVPTSTPKELQPLLVYTSLYSAFVAPTDLTPDKLPDVFVISPDGGHADRVTRTLAWEKDPAWSPDATRIAYARSDADDLEVHADDVQGEGASAIWIANADGRGAHELPGTRGNPDMWFFNENPVWSPDGTRIAFLRGAVGGSPSDGIYLVRVDGGPVRRLASRLWTGLDWSPDGRHIAALRNLPANSDAGIYLIPVDQGPLRRLASGKWWSLDWSPDGRQIAAATGKQLSIIDVATGRIAGGGVLPADLSDHPLEYSPDGRYLAVGTKRGLHILRLAGRRTTRVVVHTGFVTSLSWSPDGRRIAFTSGGVFVVRVDGRGLRRLTSGDEVDWRP